MITTHRAIWIPLLLAPLSLSASPTKLEPREREDLRYRLETMANELELLVKNQKADRSDLARQERERQGLKVFERIPFEPDIEGLQRNLVATANAHGLKIRSFRALPIGGRKARVPRQVYTDGAPFRLASEHVAQAVPFELIVTSPDGLQIRSWVDSWRESQMRLAEPTGSSPITVVGSGRWRVRGQAFRYFADTRFPKIQVRDPVALLPQWARRDPDGFARKEPRLWELVRRTRELAPQASPLYENRREFLLGDARMTFFLAKALPPNLAQSRADKRPGVP